MTTNLHDIRSDVFRHLKHFSVKIADEPIYNLASGGTSRFYVDVKKTAHAAGMHKRLGALLADAIASFDPDVVAGVALGGCHLASITAMSYDGPLNVLYVRKEPKGHGTKNLIEGPNLPGLNVVITEDVTTTGGSSIKAMAALHEAGYPIRGVVSVVDRREDKTSLLAGVPFKALFTLDEFL